MAEKLLKLALIVMVLSLVSLPEFSSCSSANESQTLTLTSPAFKDGGNIPIKYSCQGQDTPMELDWGEAPDGTKSLVLILHDPDAPVAGGFTHWVLYNIPPTTHGLPEGVTAAQLPAGTLQGNNSSGAAGYRGPCPPSGGAHHYNFTLYALDTQLNIGPGAIRSKVLDAMTGHILAQAKLTGLFQRQATTTTS